MKRIGSFIAGLLVGTMLFGGSVAYAAGVVAELCRYTAYRSQSGHSRWCCPNEH